MRLELSPIEATLLPFVPIILARVRDGEPFPAVAARTGVPVRSISSIVHRSMCMGYGFYAHDGSIS